MVFKKNSLAHSLCLFVGLLSVSLSHATESYSGSNVSGSNASGSHGQSSHHRQSSNVHAQHRGHFYGNTGHSNRYSFSGNRHQQGNRYQSYHTQPRRLQYNQSSRGHHYSHYHWQGYGSRYSFQQRRYQVSHPRNYYCPHPGPANRAPLAEAQQLTTPQNQALQIVLQATDEDNDALSFHIWKQPRHGTLSGQAPNLTYTPDAGYIGKDRFVFKASDGQLHDKAVVSIRVTPQDGGGTDENACELYPITLPQNLLGNSQAGQSFNYIRLGNGLGNYSWLTWAGNNDSNTLADSLVVPGNSHTYTNPDNASDNQIDINDWVQGAPGVKNGRSVRDNLDLLIGQDIIIPIWSDKRGQGSQFDYQAQQFGIIEITRYRLSGKGWISFVFKGYTNCQNNEPPVADDSAYQTSEDTPVTAIALASDADGDALVYTIVETIQSGTLSGTAPDYIYTPNADFQGIDSFTFTVNDGNADSNVGTVTITVLPVNDAPVADNQSLITDEDQALPVILTGFDPDGDSLSFAVATQPQNGSLSGTAPDLTYTPNADFNGSDSFTFTVNDGQLDSNVATVSIIVNPLNDAPVAVDSAVVTDEDQAIATPLTASDPDGDTIIYNIATQPQNGSLSGDAPDLVYTPNANFNGSDSFTFTVNDGQLYSNVATVSIIVNPLNDAPIADNQSLVTDEDQALPVILTGSDPDGDSLSFAVATQPQNGSLSGTAPDLTYTPNADFNGSDSFTFTVNDGQLDSNVATVSIIVNPLNDAPVAVDSAVVTDEDQAVATPLTASDPDGDPITFNIVTQPQNGTVSGDAPDLTYIPNADFNGSDSFTFSVNDGDLDSNIATVNITVNPLNDAPVAMGSAVQTDEDQAVTTPLSASDPDGDAITYRIVTQPQNGSLSGTAPDLTYTPDADFNGSDSFTFEVNDGQLDSNVATVNIIVNPLNDAPLAVDAEFITDEDQAFALPLTASDPDGDAITYMLESLPQNGTLLGDAPNLTYTPNAGFHGSDSFTFKVNDGQLDSNVATISIVINPVNDAPTADDQAVETLEGQLIEILLTGSDPENDPLTYVLQSQPQHGVAVSDGSSAEFSYQPYPDFNGVDSFTFIVNDGELDSNIATVTITVTPVSGPPRITSEAIDRHVLQPIVGDSEVVDLRPWEVIDFNFGSQTQALWQINPEGTEAEQHRNARASGLLSDFTLKNGQVKGQFKVDTASDDDYIGFVFGFQDTRNFYLFDWKQTNQNVALRGMNIKRFKSPGSFDLWGTEISGGGQNLFHNSVGWKDRTWYEFSLSFHPGEFTVTVTEVETNIVLDSFTVLDDTYASGGFGFYNYSQDSVLYRGFELETTADHEYIYPVTAVDPDNDPLTYSLLEAPEGMTIDPVTGEIRWITTTEDIGEHQVTIEVADGVDGTDQQSFTLVVTNSLPAISTDPITSTEVGRLYGYDVGAIDPTPSDEMSFSLLESPTAMTINARTGVINWIPALIDIGTHPIKIRVEDPTGGMDQQSYTLEVVPTTGNQAPVITSVADEFAQVDIEYTYSMGVTDADSSALSFTLTTAPAGMSINSLTGLIQWTPNSTQVGINPVEVRASDGVGGFAVQSFDITVFDGTAGNNLPLISSTPSAFAKVNLGYVYQITASDADGDTLSYELVSAPAGMTISPSGLISWTPDSEQNTSVHVRVVSAGAYVSQRWNLTVVSADAELIADIFVSPTNPMEGDTVTISVTPINAIGTTNISLTVDNVDIPLDAFNQAQVIASGIGSHEIEVSIADQFDTVVQTSQFYVVNPNDTNPPVVSIASPVDDQLISAPIDVVATIEDDSATTWRLVYKELEAAADEFTVIAEGEGNVTDQVLAKFDTTLVRNGQAALILEATDANGQTSQSNVVFAIEGDLKVGNFSITFEDLNIPLAGIPISVRRTYDSRDRNRQLDFGYGWSIDYQNVKVEESRTPGIGWSLNQYRAGPLGALKQFCIEPQGAPIVSVTLPDGEVERFEVAASPECNLAAVFLDVELDFKPLGDNQSKLKALDDSKARYVNGALVERGEFADPVNPSRYQLTTRAGYVYELEQDFGVKTIIDPNGNTLDYTSEGIIHSSGKRIDFMRDATGRITSVVDPMGNSINYDYDTELDLVAVADRDAATTTFDYNRSHGLLEITDPLGRSMLKNIYDDDGRLIAQEDENGNRTEFDHDIDGRQSIVTDRNGHTTFLFYDDRGNVSTTVDALGNTTTFTFDGRDNQLTQTDALGNQISATYNTNNDQLTQTDALGNVTAFAYNTRGQETTITDARGNVFENTYDTIGNLLKIEDPLGNIAGNNIDQKGLPSNAIDVLGNETTFTYDDEGNKLTETDPEGNVMSFTYDENNNVLSETSTRQVNGSPVNETSTYEYDDRDRVVKTIDALGNETVTEFNLAGREVANVDALGRRTTMTYDVYGRLLTTTYPDGTVMNKTYDPEGNLKTDTDRLGRVTTYDYDAVDRLIKTTYPDTSSTQTEYDAIGRVSTEIDAIGNRTEYVYDAAGRRTQVTDALGNITQYAYDADGNMTSMTDANGNTTAYVYNALDQKIQTIFANASTMLDGLDALSRKTSMTDQAGVVTSYEYDGLGRLVKVIDALNQETTYTYDSAGNKLTQTDAEGRTTNWEYDALGRVIKRILPLGQQETMAYDAIGNLTQHTDFNGQVRIHNYDVNNRLTNTVYANGLSETYTYDLEGNRTRAVKTENSVATTTNYTFDNLNRLASETQFAGTANAVTLSYQYDAQGNRITLIETKGAATKITRYTFDQLNRLKTVTDANGNVTTYGYDAVGNRSIIDYANGNSVDYVYDDLNRLTNLAHKDSANLQVASYDYTLHPTGRRTRISEQAGRISDYVYDDLYRMTSEIITDAVNGDHSSSYGYDKVGNRTYETVNGVQTQYTIDANDRLLQTGGTTFTFDANGNTLTETLDGSTTTYAYNARNELKSTTKAGNTTSYQYNIDGIRIGQSNVTEAVIYTVDTNRNYAQVLAEHVNGAETVAYTYGDDLVSEQMAADTYYYHYDGLGSTRALSNSVGTFTDTYDYEAFGEVLNQGGTTENKYLFAGEQFDAGQDRYYLRARYYDQKVGRFGSMDSWMGIDADLITLNKYVYANVDPVNMIDPTGNFGIGSFSAASNVRGVLSTTASSNASRFFSQAIGATLKATGRATTKAALRQLRKCIRKKNKCGFNANILVVGYDNPDMLDHIRDAQNSRPNTLVLNYVKNKKGNRRWYRNGGGRGGCKLAEKPAGHDCDEYPFFKTREGGPTNANRVSLRWVPAGQNRSIGAHFGFLSRAMNKQKSRRPSFVVVTSHSLPSVSIPAGR